jgi:RNA polymerase sigma factor (sigma-70 family)
MTVILTEGGLSADGELVAESRRGNREAFGRLVRKYQGMVTGVIYSVCGDFHRSEEIAQETFLAAWKSLSGMNDAEKLSPWLRQIARRKAIDFQRTSARDKSRLGQLFPPGVGSEGESPVEEALAAEEREILWRVLSELPEPYRETMVLYYRQSQSAAAVALAMEATEDAVRQRLVRGRGMVRHQMAEMLERNLVRSAPSPAFAVAILAALPALTGPAAKGATAGAAAKGSSVLGGGGAMAWGAALLSMLVAAWCGLFTLQRALRASRSRRERRFLFIFAGVAALCLGAFVAVNIFGPRLFSGDDFHGMGVIGLVIGLTIIVLIVIRQGRRRLHAIRVSEPSDRAAPVAPCAGNPRKMPLGMVVAVVFSCLGAWFTFAWRAGDFQSVAILSILAIGLTLLAAYCWGGDSMVRSRRFSLLYIPILGIITLSINKWRLNEWLGVIHHWKHPHPMPWSGLILMATVFVCGELVAVELVGGWKHSVRRRVPKDVSIGSVRRLNMPGFNFLFLTTQTTLKTIRETSKVEVPKFMAAVKDANIERRGPLVYIFPNFLADGDGVLDLKIGIAVDENAVAPEGCEIEALGPVDCQTVLFGGSLAKLGHGFERMIPEIFGGKRDSTPTGEFREYFLHFVSVESANNVTLIAGVVKPPGNY